MTDLGISIVCVFNDSAVRQECLDRSIQVYAGAVDIDYIPIDNTGGAFASAGAALNHGARRARHDLIAFVHQDVYLHSIDRLVVAGSALHKTWGLLGANGVTGQAENVGRLRDRAQLIGRHALLPVEVDSVDEVLFLLRRDVVLEHPLSEEPDLAWHAYAVDLSVRLRLLGLRVGAVDMAITHNSLTVNLNRLDVAHRRVGADHPGLTPIRTTCGTIGGGRVGWRELPLLRRHRWRLRWLRHSVVAARVRKRLDLPVVLSDIRHDLDLISFSEESPLQIFNVDRTSGFADFESSPLHLTRYQRPVVMRAVSTLPALFDALDAVPDNAGVLVMGLELRDLDDLPAWGTGQRAWLAGIHQDTLWFLGGSAAIDLPEAWTRPAAVPLSCSRREPVE